MSKELPYFKFIPTEWLLGSIYHESLETQGLFINICALYWQRECKLDIATINQRLSHPSGLQNLNQKGLIEWNNKTDFIKIKFLDDQWQELQIRHVMLSESGRKGGQASVKARSSKAQALRLRLRKDKEEDIIETIGLFKKPTIEQIAEYCKERNNNIEPKYFFDKNEGIGWVVGKNRSPMKDWKAVIRTWEKFSKPESEKKQISGKDYYDKVIKNYDRYNEFENPNK